MIAKCYHEIGNKAMEIEKVFNNGTNLKLP